MKKQLIIQFLQQNPQFLNNVKGAFKAYLSTGNEVSYARFYNVFKEVAEGNAVALPMAPQEGEIGSEITFVPKQREREKVRKSTVSDLQFDDRIFVPIQSGTPLDNLVSTSRGTLPATITIVPGESGVGKTTIILHYLGKVKEANPDRKILFISSEMNPIHMYKYAKRVKIPGVEIVYLGEYDQPKEVLEDVLQEGWDIVFGDSFQDIVDKVRGTSRMTAGEAETWLIDLMCEVRMGNNDLKLYTAFFMTQHMTKGAVYTGSTKVKHNTDAMMELRKCQQVEGDTYIEYSKNRDGKTGERLYYKIDENGVTFDLDRYERDLATRKEVEHAREVIAQREEDFDAVFFGNTNTTDSIEVN